MVTLHPNASNPPPAVIAQAPTPQKNAKANQQPNVLLAAVTTKPTIGNVMKRKNILIVQQQLASQLPIDTPLHPLLHPPPPDILYFSSEIATPFSTNSPNAAKKQRPKSTYNKDASQSSSAPTNRNTNPCASEPRPGVNTRSHAGSNRHSSEMDSLENS